MQYLYKVNYDNNNEQLCKLESSILFKKRHLEKCFFSDVQIIPSQSVYIKERLELICSASSLDKMIYEIARIGLSFNNFKVIFMKCDKSEYKDTLEIIKMISHCINGEGNIKEPQLLVAITLYNGTWYLGYYLKNDYYYKKHNDKPYSYSNALGIDLARTIINIASKNDRSKKIIDPCCGIGTVVCEGLSMDMNIIGSEINSHVVYKAIENLKYFGYKPVITIKDINHISEYYDVSIVDIPYGIMSEITKKEQLNIIKSCYRISSELILISRDNMDNLIKQAGYKNITSVILKKSADSKFSRTISICN